MQAHIVLLQGQPIQLARQLTPVVKPRSFNLTPELGTSLLITVPRQQSGSRAVATFAASMATQSKADAKKRRLVLWFRNDLRLHDNYMVHEAVTAVQRKQAAEVLPVYVFDPRSFAVSPWGSPKTGAFRAKFLLESVLDLKAQLRQRGSDLLVAVGQPETLIPGLLQGSVEPLVLTMQETTSEELKVEQKVIQAIKPAAGQLKRVWGHTLYHLDDLQADKGPFPQSRRGIQGMPDMFTPFKNKCEEGCGIRPEVPSPAAGALPLPDSSSQVNGSGSLAELLAWQPDWKDLPWPTGVPAQPVPHPKAVLDFKGGETAALARLKYYLWDTDLVSTYFDTRNGMLGGDFSTKFSPWLAAGCLSPRTVHHAIKKYEKQRVANKSTYWVIFELIWRDFYKFFSIKHGNRIFFQSGVSGKQLTWSADPELWSRWRDGMTGLPLVDANMRELAATGFMSNRGRQNVASHLVLDMGVDWRRGADLFESLLLDHDVTSNYGNWVAAAGLTGGRLNLFNITKQSKDYDPEGEYIKAWLPELKNVPATRIHEPWLMSKEEQARYGVQLGVTYPVPIPKSRYGRPHEATGSTPERWGNSARAQSAGGGNRHMGSGRQGAGARGGGGAGRRPQPGRGRQSEFERFG